jgi:hypothetical protein
LRLLREINTHFSNFWKGGHRGKDKKESGIFSLSLFSVFYLTDYFSFAANEN